MQRPGSDGRRVLMSVAAFFVVAALFVWWIDRSPAPRPQPPTVPPIAMESPTAAPSTVPAAQTPNALASPQLKTSKTLMHFSNNSYNVEASSLQIDEKHKRAVANDVLITFTEPKNHSTVAVTAREADINMDNLDVDFQGKVVARASTGEVLEVQNMRWDGKNRKLFGKDSIKLTRGKSWMTGDEMVADATLQTVEIKGNVRIYFVDKNSGPTAFGKNPQLR